jgi:diacylglycerol kinase family enzyme
MRIAVIINPIAGRGRRRPAGEARARLARDLAARAGVEADIEITRFAGHGAELARAFVAAGHSVIAAWGGDGTVNDVAGSLIGSASALAIIPSGSGNGLARGLGLPARPDTALSGALGADRTPLDVGYIGARHFLNVAGLGFDAAVARRFSRSGRYGSISYGLHALAGLWSYRCAPYDLVLDGSRTSGRRFLIAFANSRQYGNGLVIAPDADTRDGLLNAIVVNDGAAVTQLWRARRLFVNRLAPAEGVRRLTVRTATVEGPVLAGHVDGEPFGVSGRLDVRIEPGAITLAGVAAPRSRSAFQSA